VLYREETNHERDMHLVLWDQDRGELTRKRVGRTPWKINACHYAVTCDRKGSLTVWPTRGQIDFARPDGKGDPSGPAETETPGRSGTWTGMLALSAPDGGTLVAWKKDGRTGWQLYDGDGKASGPAGSVESSGNGVAGVLGKDGR